MIHTAHALGCQGLRGGSACTCNKTMSLPHHEETTQERVEKMSDAKPSNPKDAAATTRLDLSVFPPSAVAYGALAFVEGGLKYGEFNWREAGVLASVYKAALDRHMGKWWNGEEVDPKTLVPHLANAIACLAVLIDAIEQDNLNDDRPPKQSSSLYDRFQDIVAHLQTVFPRRATRYRAKH